MISVLLPLPETELSLEEAVERMQTGGTQAEAAQMSRRSDEAIAAGYQDTASSISDSLDMMKFLPLEQQYFSFSRAASRNTISSSLSFSAIS